MVQLFGNEDHPDFQSAIAARTTDLLMNLLQEKGFRGFRAQVIETVDYCLPIALASAAEEVKTQASNLCPDNTDYKATIDDLGSTEDELRARYGSYWSKILGQSAFKIRINILTAFPELFYFGDKDHPKFAATESSDVLNAILMLFAEQDISKIASQVEPALTAAREYQGPEMDRVENIKGQLLCLQDWMDIYPTDDIARLGQ